MTCPACGAEGVEPVLDLPGIPVQCTEILRNPEDALRVPRGDVQLTVCVKCAYVWNSTFDEELVEYDGDYENSQFFSPSFTEYASELASHLVTTYGVRDGVIVEIGSGKGEFLALICRAGSNRGIGYDPSYAGESDARAVELGITFVREFYSESVADQPVDLVCARHVLEHIGRPLEFLTSVRAAMRRSGARAIYLEVPNAAFTFGGSGLWDVIYQHCSYFSAPALRMILQSAGFELLDLRETFDGQFLAAEARASSEARSSADQGAIRTFLTLVRQARDLHRENLERWGQRLAELEDRRVLLWGAGAKGAMFLNMMPAGAVDTVVDVNPRKWGSFVPGVGQRVAAPDELAGEAEPALVILSNGRYHDEVRADLQRLGMTAPLVAL